MKQVKTALNEREYKQLQKIIDRTGKTEYELLKDALLSKYPQISF